LVKEITSILGGVGKKLGIRDVVERSKSTLKEVLDFVDINEVAKYGAEFCSCLLLGIDIVKIAEKMKGKEEFELKKKVVVIIDDLAELNFIEKASLLTLVNWLKKNNARILLVRRINLEEEFIKISEKMGKSYVRDANEMLAGSPDAMLFEDKEQVIFITTNFETFKEIIEANVEGIKHEDIWNLYYASGGLPTLAILMHNIGVKYGEETAKDVYFSIERAKNDKDRARATLNVVYNGIKSVYERAKEKNLALLALFVQPVASDEIERFCEDGRIKKTIGRFNCGKLDGYERIVEFHEEEWFEGKKRKVYELSESWRHMRLFLDVLCDLEENIEEEVKAVREILLDIMTSNSEKTGGRTGRMLLSALENMGWLKERSVFKLKEALLWGGVALSNMPPMGFEFRLKVLDMWDKVEHNDEILLYSSAYAHQLVEFGRTMGLSREDYLTLVDLAEEFMGEETKDDATLCYRAMAYLSSAFGLSYFGLIEESQHYLEKAKKIIKSIEDLKEVAEFYFYLNIARLEYKPLESLNKALEYLNSIEKNGMTDAMRRFLKLYGGKVEEKFKDSLKEWRNAIYFELGKHTCWQMK